MNQEEALKIKLLAAKNAIDALGGMRPAAEKIAALSGRHVTRYRVRYWLEAGVDPKFCPHVHQLTDIPLTQLDPEVYPVYLFAS